MIYKTVQYNIKIILELNSCLKICYYTVFLVGSNYTILSHLRFIVELWHSSFDSLMVSFFTHSSTTSPSIAAAHCHIILPIFISGFQRKNMTLWIYLHIHIWMTHFCYLPSSDLIFGNREILEAYISINKKMTY